MTITTYDDLKDKFTESTLNWMARTFSDDEADEFIDLAEADFNMSLRCREMEAVTDLSPTSNVYTLPTDYLEYKRVVEKASIRRRLDFITEDAVDALYPTRESGLSCNFTIIGGSLYTYPLSSNDVELTYYQKVPALSDSTTTNWLLTRLPNLYLHAAMYYAAEYIGDTEKMAAELAFVERCKGMLMSLDNRAKFASAGITLAGPVW